MGASFDKGFVGTWLDHLSTVQDISMAQGEAIWAVVMLFLRGILLVLDSSR